MDHGVLSLWTPDYLGSTFWLLSASLLNSIMIVCMLGLAWACVELRC